MAFSASTTASLPIEPASPDDEVLSKGESVEIDIERPAPAPLKKDPPPRRSQGSLDTLPTSSRVESSRSGVGGIEKRVSRSEVSSQEAGAGDFSLQGRMAMTASGFGGIVKLVQYPEAWLGVTETFRYYKNDEEDRLYLNRKAVLIGIELHPFRRSMISPFLDIQGGWENFERDQGLDAIKSPLIEGVAGVELKLTNFASVIGQWTEAGYSNLKEPIFYTEKSKDPKRYQAAQVLINLKWERKLF